VQLPLNFSSVGLQATQYGHVPLFEDILAKSPYVATAGLIPAVTVAALSDGDGWEHQSRSQNQIA
jgi:hypothetical protein